MNGWVIKQFNMENVKPACTLLANHFKLSKSSCASSRKETKEIATVSYSSVIGNLMYVMVCIRPNIAHNVGVVSNFFSNPGKDHWEDVEWILKYLKGASKI